MIPRRVAYVVKYFPKFSETFIASELVELQRRDIQVCILAFREPTVALRHDFITDAGLDRATAYGVEKFDDVLEKFRPDLIDRKSTRLNSSHLGISYAVFCL